MEDAAAQVSTLTTGLWSNRDRLTLIRRVEAVVRMLPAASLEWTAQMREQWSNAEFPANNLVDTLADTLRITPAEARARWRAAEDLAPRIGMTGESLQPLLPETATAYREGALAPAHVTIIRDAMRRLPAVVDATERAEAEAMLAGLAREMRPDYLRKVTDQLDTIVNPDGTFTDSDRARRRTFTMGRQGPDLMTKCTMVVDPETRALLEAIFAKWAKPGVLNPDDATPVANDEPDEAAVQRDSRSAGQRQHDAVKAALRNCVASGELGQHRGLPTTVIVSMSLQELEDAVAQVAPGARIDTGRGTGTVSGPPVITGGGALISIGDALRLASHAHHYLALFDHHDGRPLYLGRSKRIATADQRIVLHARDIGCTFPGCTKPGFLCQVHHRTEWAAGGTTDADQLTFVCEPHHQQAGTDSTTWQADPVAPGQPNAGRTQWIPPVHIDPARRPRVNRYHHPGEYFAPTSEPASRKHV
nr:HNH endonuclease signature motif containing protein [Nocardia aurantia]